MGTVVSIGHSDATAGQARAALAEGARTFTHLFNAMSPLGHREPGVLGAALNSTVPVGIICDGIHVADEVLALAIRARPAPDLFYAVSDAMPTVAGRTASVSTTWTCGSRKGRLVNPEGNLAGAHVTLAESLARLVTRLGIAPEAALRMVVTVPARLIGRPDLARIEGRELSELRLVDEAWGVTTFSPPNPWTVRARGSHPILAAEG
jgi:N-acetylglucosamine-6-phosphate deacetylase